MEHFIFLDNPHEFMSENTHNILMGSSVSDKEHLMNDFQKRLCFPEYFGKNWDALYDCLLSLDDLVDAHASKDIALIYEKLPTIDNVSLKRFLEVLHDAASTLTNFEGYRMFIVFPQTSFATVQSLCDG